MNANPTTLRELAETYGMQDHEIAAFLDLGTTYDIHDELDEATLAEYRDMLDAGAAVAEQDEA